MTRPPTNDGQIRDLERIVSRQPESRFFAALAEAYLERGEAPRAVEVCERGLAGNPGFVRGLTAYARALCLSGNVDAARAVYAQARAEHPRDSSIATSWGSLLVSQGLLDEARAALTEALQVNPLDVDARHILATLPQNEPSRRTLLGTPRIAAPPPAPVAYQGSDEITVIDSPPPVDEGAMGRTTRWEPPAPPAAPRPADDALPWPPPLSGPPADYGAPAPAFIPPAAARPQAVPPPPPAAASEWLPPLPPPPSPGAPARVPPAPARAPAAPVATALPSRPRAGSARPAAVAYPRIGAGSARGRRPTGGSGRIILAVVLLLCAVAIGIGVYLRGMRRQVTSAVTGVDEQLADGGPAAYRDAEARLVELLELHPRDGRIAARLAEVAAMRGLRFDGGPEALARAEVAVRRATNAGAGSVAGPARALLRLAGGDAGGAAEIARAAVPKTPGGAAVLVLGLAEKARGNLATAEEQLALAWSGTPHSALAGCELAAVQRRRGRLGEARATLEAVRAAVPQDLCARLESVLLLRQSGGEGTRVEREALRSPSEPHAALRARIRYADALVAAGEWEPSDMRSALEEALKTAPWEPEYVWALGRAHLLPGGDARRAVDLLGRPAATAGVPEALLDLVEGRLRVGQATAAAETLAGIDVATLPETYRGRFEALRITAHHELLQRNAVHVYCAAVEQSARPDDDVLLNCALVARDEGVHAEVRRLAGRIARPDLKPIARGLALLAAGDAAGAVEPLGRAAESHAAPGPTTLLLAEALEAAARDEQARGALRRAVTADARSARARVALARALAGAGRRDDAVRLLDAVLAERPSSPRLAGRIALTFVALGDAARAHDVLKVRPTLDAPWYRHVTGLVALAAKDQERASQEFQAAAAADASFAEPRFELARLAAQAGRPDDATARYDAALRSSPDDPYRRLLLAVAQAEAGYGDDAEHSLELARKGLEAAGARGLVAEGYLALARSAAAGDAKRARRAERLYGQALALPGAPGAAFYRTARFHEARHDVKAALAEYRTAIERDPQQAEATLRLGLLLAADRKSRDEAVARLRAYLKLLPDGEHGERVRAELRRLGAAP